ncbi:MAG TPA: M20 family peptidase [Burkholderiales bacterium]|nr:M20 family peptidase [Burkholderiales bacterium]
MRRIWRALLVLIVALVVVLAVNAARSGSRQIEVPRAQERLPELEPAVQRLAQAIRLQTVSHQDPADLPSAEFEALHRLLERSFPRMSRTLERERIGGLSLLFQWPGSDPAAKPILLLAHLDVVPADAATLREWTHPPFSGAVADGFVWGRGARDDKSGVMALHEAVEALLAQGFQPRRTVYLAFGHDEELGGVAGAAQIARMLAERGVKLETVLDEGMPVTHGLLPGIEQPVALIGIAEKGNVTLELVAQGEGGHASMPPPQTAVSILGAALAKLEASRFPASLTEPLREQLAFLGPEQGLLRRVLFSNLWLFGGVVQAQLAKSRAGNALVRTTVAPTLLEGGIKENVLPASARALVNFRLLPGTSIEALTRQVVKIVDDDRVRIAPAGALRSEPSPVSSVRSEAFRSLQRAVEAVFPEALVAPSLLVGATDSRHFTPLADNVFRFRPARTGTDDVARFHGVDERLAVENYAEFIGFYMRYLREAAGGVGASRDVEPRSGP